MNKMNRQQNSVPLFYPSSNNRVYTNQNGNLSMDVFESIGTILSAITALIIVGLVIAFIFVIYLIWKKSEEGTLF